MEDSAESRDVYFSIDGLAHKSGTEAAVMDASNVSWILA